MVRGVVHMNKTIDVIDREYPKEVGDALRKAWMIVVIGKMGSGKTTEVTRIAKFLDKEVLIISPNRPEEDLKLFGSNKLPVLEKGKRVKSSVEKLTKKEGREMTVIFDDAQALTKRQQEYMTSKGLHTDLRHRNLTLIFIYHDSRYIPARVLYGGDSFLIIKKGVYFTEHKLSQYLTVKKISSVILDYCNSFGEHDSLYLFKDGFYYYVNGSEMLGEFRARTRGYKFDRKFAYELFYQGFTIQEVAEKIGCGAGTARQMAKELQEEDKSFTLAHSMEKKPVSDLGFGIRDKSYLITKRIKEPLNTGEATGEKIQRIEKMKCSEDKGNLATRVIGDILEDILKRAWPKSESNIILIINEGRGGGDIILEFDSNLVEVEIKNWNSNSTHRNLTPSDIKNKVIPRFSDKTSIRWLFACGVKCNKDARMLLRENNVQILNLTREQITNPDSDQRYRLRRRLWNWCKNLPSIDIQEFEHRLTLVPPWVWT